MRPQLYRPVGIILLAVNYLFIGCFGTLFLPIFLWLFPPLLHKLIAQAIHTPALSVLATCVIMTVWASGYVLYALIGYGMIRLRPWSLKAAIAIHWFGLALVLVAVAVVARYDWMLSVATGAFCLLWVGGILYYLRRPRVRWAFDAATAIAKSQPIPSQPPASSIPTWKIVTSVTALFVIGVTVFVLGLMSSVEKSFRSSTAYAIALDRAQASPCVARTLGRPIVAKGFISGNLSTGSDTGEADLEIPVHGPKTGGSLHVEAKEMAGSWIIKSLTLEHSAGQIQLAPTASTCD